MEDARQRKILLECDLQHLRDRMKSINAEIEHVSAELEEVHFELHEIM
jgi:hypothetical protein